MKKKWNWIGTVLTLLFFTIGILIMRSGLWMLNTWQHLSMDELIFHLKAPMDGTNQELITSFLTSCLLTALLAGALLFLVFFCFRKRKKLYKILHWLTLASTFVCIGISIFLVWSKLELDQYVDDQTTYSTFIDTNYVDPADVTLTFPEKKRNLIHIYLESIETTYTNTENGGAFDRNLIPELTKMAQKYEDFSGEDSAINGAIPLAGSSWTMGALFAQSSGLPLSLPIDGNAMHGQESFLPALTTMGDILQNAGYQQAFMIGSDAVFGGRELYYKDHGDYLIWDLEYFKTNGDIPKDYYVWWGFEDLYLLELAKEKLTWLASQEQPFNFTLLTVDTHYEDGYVCADCPNYYLNDQYANVIRCSSKKINEFIAWIQEQDFYENTTIVLTGDHNTMDSNFCSSVSSDYQRRVFTAYINAPVEVQNNTFRTYSTFDIFPTTLASLGVDIENNRLGLGTNLFADKLTLCEEYGKDYMNQEIRKKSLLMDEITKDVTYAKAAITITKYRPVQGAYEVLVNEMNHSLEIEDIRCLAWTKEDQSDAKWYIIPYNGEIDHKFLIYDTDFSKDTDTLYVQVFAYGTNTIMYSLGTAEKNIQ